MPESVIHAFADHGEVRADAITGSYAEAQQVMDALAAVGIDYDDVVQVLEREGVEKFNVSGNEMIETVRSALEAAK
jgi:transaldolase